MDSTVPRSHAALHASSLRPTNPPISRSRNLLTLSQLIPSLLLSIRRRRRSAACQTTAADRVVGPALAITSAPAHPLPRYASDAVSVTERTEMMDRFNFCGIGCCIDGVSFKHAPPNNKGQLVRLSSESWRRVVLNANGLLICRRETARRFVGFCRRVGSSDHSPVKHVTDARVTC